MDYDAISEADENIDNVQQALDNLLEKWVQWRIGDETMSIANMYERAAWNTGATYEQTSSIVLLARKLARQKGN